MKPSRGSRVVLTAAAVPKPNQPANKAIMWPSTDFSGITGVWRRFDRTAFPSEHAITMRHGLAETQPVRNTTDALCSVSFIEAARQAQVRIWFLDPKFDTKSMFILEAIVEQSEAEDIRIISGNHGTTERRRIEASVADVQDTANRRQPPPPRKIGVRWLARLDKYSYPFLHDRFAIIDDELWHFGATVGGGYKGLNAVSRGWNAKETLAIEFFERLWKHFDRG